MKKNKIKLIILDLYGVIVLGSYKETCIYMSKKYKLSFQLLWDTFYVKYFNQAALGKITDQQSFQYAIRELNIPIKWDVLYKKHLSFLTLSKQSFEYAKSLQRRGYKILLLSKNTPLQFKDIVKKTKVNKYFKNIINTYDLGLPKASQATMRYITKKFKVKPGEVIIVDDYKDNLVIPKKIGMHAFHYTNYKKMRREMSACLKN